MGLARQFPASMTKRPALPFRRNIRHPRDPIAYRAFSVPSGTSTCAERRSLILDGPRGQGDGAGLGSANPGRTPGVRRSAVGPFPTRLTSPRNDDNFCISRELQQHGSRERGRRCGRVPHVCPVNIKTMIRMHTMHRKSPAARAVPGQAQPSQREGQGFESP